jgi:hypothetical protein
MLQPILLLLLLLLPLLLLPIQGRLSAALDDYAAAMARCPWSVDPVLNRGVALEALGR